MGGLFIAVRHGQAVVLAQRQVPDHIIETTEAAALPNQINDLTGHCDRRHQGVQGVP
ncbi:hypothetical protein [Micromonospora chersina]|uniref:hypothetical protein n=1 Tax=Micromonospora chersina TaxID=47854 RepID=UPI00372384F6